MFYVIDRIAYIYALQNNQGEAKKWLEKFEKKLPPEAVDTFYRGYGQYAAYCYAKSGNKKKALELSQHWRVYLALGMKDEALQNIAMALKPSSRYIHT